MHWPGLVIPYHWGARRGDLAERGISQKGEELEDLETSINDYHIYGNLRIHSSICGRTLKTEHILCLTCVRALSGPWNSIEKFGNFKTFLHPFLQTILKGKTMNGKVTVSPVFFGFSIFRIGLQLIALKD